MRRIAFHMLSVGVIVLGLAVAVSPGQMTGGTTTAAGGSSEVAGQITGGERFLRENRTAGSFVGGAPATGGGAGFLGDATGTTGQLGTSRMLGGSMFSPYGGMGGMSSLYTMGMMNAAMNNRQRPLRMPLRLGTEVLSEIGAASAKSAPAVTVARVQSQLADNPRVKAMGSVTVAMEGPTAVLKGTVKSEHDRQLLGKLLLLEPGISVVRNDLQVAPAAKAPAPKP